MTDSSELETAEDVRAHQPAQWREGRAGTSRVRPTPDPAAELRRAAEQSGIEKIEERPEIAKLFSTGVPVSAILAGL